MGASKKSKVCKAKNSKDKCVVYEAKHSNKKAADIHSKKIKARGGLVKRSNKGESIVLNYSFPKK